MKRKPKRIKEKRYVAKGKCLAMIKKKHFIDLPDLAMYWDVHPVSLRKAVREGRVLVYHRGGQYVFDMDVIKSLPRPRIGRPRKSRTEEVGKSETARGDGDYQ